MQPIKLFILQMYFLCRILSATARAADQPNPCRLLPGRNGERKGSADMPKILSAHDAVRQYIHDGDTVTFGGFASGLMHPESILRALEERARNGEGPHGLTALYAAGQGDSDSRGLNHLGVEGLCRRVIGGHWGLSPKLGRLCAENKLAGYNLPQGVIAPLFRDIAAGKPGVITHVGLGTFRPVKEEEITDHEMHSEYCVISQETADLINRTKANGGRCICVGTTSCRTLESWAAEDGHMEAKAGWTNIYIYPGYRFKVMDGLVTNFHLPESTLIMLVSAFAGREHVLAAYEEAVREKYRFFSFGDAMFLR